MGFVKIRAGRVQQSVIVCSYILWAYFIYYFFKEMLYSAMILILLMRNVLILHYFFIIIRYKLVYVGYEICFHILVILTITSSCKELWKCSIGAFGNNLLLNPFNALQTFFSLILFIYNSLIQSLINIYQRSTEYMPGTSLIRDIFSFPVYLGIQRCD